jgi:hypothetical protein
MLLQRFLRTTRTSALLRSKSLSLISLRYIHQSASQQAQVSFLRTIHSSQIVTPMPSLPRDVQDFIAGYPDIPDNPSKNANLNFYSANGTQRCQPDNKLIEEIHEQCVCVFLL